MSATLNKIVNSWEREISKALQTGKGKYRGFTVEDLFDYRELIAHIRAEGWGRAFKFWEDLDRDSREAVPSKIRCTLEARYTAF